MDKVDKPMRACLIGATAEAKMGPKTIVESCRWKRSIGKKEHALVRSVLGESAASQTSRKKRQSAFSFAHLRSTSNKTQSPSSHSTMKFFATLLVAAAIASQGVAAIQLAETTTPATGTNAPTTAPATATTAPPAVTIATPATTATPTNSTTTSTTDEDDPTDILDDTDDSLFSDEADTSDEGSDETDSSDEGSDEGSTDETTETATNTATTEAPSTTTSNSASGSHGGKADVGDGSSGSSAAINSRSITLLSAASAVALTVAAALF
ncbi:hypothetical protein KRP22_014774 [Phytophthora ramorum]|nr:hypothetical protein KRP22_14551 [Phytophthora ramorum]